MTTVGHSAQTAALGPVHRKLGINSHARLGAHMAHAGQPRDE